MLALSRKKDEAVIINDDIEITIIEIKGDQVKIGISAPKSVPIYRKEVYMQIQNANSLRLSRNKSGRDRVSVCRARLRLVSGHFNESIKCGN